MSKSKKESIGQLSENQKNYIAKNYKKQDVEKIASFLKIEKEIVEKFIKEHLEKKYPFYFYIILFVLPFLFIFLIELFLRAINYGEDYPKWIEVNENFEMLHPDIAKKFFYNLQTVPNHNQDAFLKKKDNKVFRIFIFGESSAAGFPYIPNGGFHRRLRDFLTYAYPDKNFEIINTGISAISSYFWIDIYKDVFERNPDAIIFYAGHNEYYGSLAVGSVESVGKNRFIIKLYLKAINSRIVQLIRNFLVSIVGTALQKNSSNNQTLMAKIAKEKFIEKDSKLYKDGIEQFVANMKEILKYAHSKNIPVILCSVASNLKDQKPFESNDGDSSKSATYFYNKAWSFYNKSFYKEADSLFRLAKDLDLLKFRAPEEINLEIKKLANEFNCSFVDIDSAMSFYSPRGIIGNELMTDHLHPNEVGYQIIAKELFKKISEKFFSNKKPVYDLNKLDSLTFANLNFSEIDRKTADFILGMLKSDYPYVKKNEKANLQIKLRNRLDSLAYDFKNKKINWDKLRIEAANYYLELGDTIKYLKEFDILVDQYPYISYYYKEPIEFCITIGNFNKALEYLNKYNYYTPDAYSYKWTGSIYLSLKKYALAVRYLEKSVNLRNDDYQSWHNLAGAYYYVDEIDKAIFAAEKALSLNPNEENTKIFLKQIKELKNSKLK